MRKVNNSTVYVQTLIKHVLEIIRIISNGDHVPLYLTKTLSAVDIPSVREEYKSPSSITIAMPYLF